MTDQRVAERNGLDKKDKGELQTIVSALGGKPSSRSRKSELIDQILELSGAEPADEQQTLEVDEEESGVPESEVKAEDTPTDEKTDPSTNGDGETEAKAPKSDNGQSGEQSESGSSKAKSGNGNAKSDDDDEPNKRRRRGRGRGRGRDRENAGSDPVVAEPFAVEGYLELRDEGYGFLRVNSFLPSKDDVYVSVKQVRQFGLRKGDHLTGLSRAASRNEKNPGFHQIETVNGQSAENAKQRSDFDSLTPVSPDHEIQLQSDTGESSLAAGLVDIFSPLGRGQRALISGPARVGVTTFVRDLAQAIEQNNPNIDLLVLLIDQRPEETSWLRAELSDAEVIASAYDRSPDEHCAIAEITLERGKRLVEAGRDVCLLVDGASKLAQAYQAVSSQSSRGTVASVENTALYQLKRMFGTARKLEEGGSLSIVAAAQEGTSGLAGLIPELASGANSHIQLRRDLADAGVFPAIDVVSSRTRREDVLLGEEQSVELARLRAAIVDQMSSDESIVSGTATLIERIKSSATIDDFLADIMKSLS